MQPKICSNCGRTMELNEETDMFVCVCGNKEPIYYRRDEEWI